MRSVKAQLILDAIADAEELSVDDAELTDYLVRQAARYNMAPQDFANQIMEAGNLRVADRGRAAQQGAGRGLVGGDHHRRQRHRRSTCRP